MSPEPGTVTESFDPTRHIEGAATICDGGEWPNFHDAIVYSLHFWRGDMRPDDDVWIGPTIDATLELDALEFPFVVDLRFHDCSHIRMSAFDHNNDLFDLSFAFVARGFYTDGKTPLPPYIDVAFGRGHGESPLLALKCFRIEVIARRPVPDPPCR